jgi:hypothetical protein
MSRKSKIIEKILSHPTDFTWDELKKVLKMLGYSELKGGSSSGSRMAFYNKDIDHVIRLHRPHPDNILKLYQIKLIVNELKEKGLI